MLVIGALASVGSAGIVLTVGGHFEILDTQELARDFNVYLLTEPARSFGALVVFYGLAYGAAWGISKFRHRNDKNFDPDGSVWYQALATDCPADAVPYLTVELADSRMVVGTYRQATVERDDNRELALGRPLGEASATGNLRPLRDEFILLREADIRRIAGRYLREFPVSDGGIASIEERPQRQLRTKE
jgi:hypothetical protein